MYSVADTATPPIMTTRTDLPNESAMYFYIMDYVSVHSDLEK